LLGENWRCAWFNQYALKGNLLKYQIDSSDSSVVVIDSDLMTSGLYSGEIKKVKTVINRPIMRGREQALVLDHDKELRTLV